MLLVKGVRFVTDVGLLRICIGLNLESVLRSCQDRFWGLSAPQKAYEVRYRDINDKPDFFRDRPSLSDMLLTKAKDWEHEQEMRLIAEDPHWVGSAYDVPKEFYEEESIDGKEIRHYPRITPDGFESVYLGVNMLPRKKEQIIEIAKKLNLSIKTIDTHKENIKAKLHCASSAELRQMAIEWTNKAV